MPEFGIVNINRHTSSNIRTSDYLPAWTGVRFKWRDEIVAEAGNDTGRVMEIESPWATYEIASILLQQINEDRYLPYSADDVVIDPAYEVGDAVEISGGLSVIFSSTAVYDSLFSANVSAPADNEIDHEFPYSEAAKFDKSAEDTILEELDDPESPISESLEDFLGDQLQSPDSPLSEAINRKIADIDALYTRGTDHVEISTDHMSLVTGYDPHEESAGEGEEQTAAVQEGTTKLYIGYEISGQTQQGEPIVSPIFIMGAGNASGTNIGYIRKPTDGMQLLFKPNNTEQGEPRDDIGVVMRTDGVMELRGYNPVELVDELPAVLTPGKFYAIAEDS